MASTNGSSASTRVKRRGIAKNEKKLQLKEFYGGPIPVEIKPEYMKVTGDNAGVFTAELGIIVRGCGKLLIYESWLDVPEIEKQIMYNEIKQHFQVDFNDPHHKEVVDLQLHTRLKDYRHEVKSHWNLFDPDEALRNPYKSVRSEVWSVLCNRFMSEKHKEISEQNQRNRAALQVNHCGGSKSFVRYIEEKKTSQNGVQPSLVDVYEETHHHPEKGWTCEKARELHGELVATVHDLDPTDGDKLEKEKQAFVKVLGKRPKYICGLGYGVKPPPARPNAELENERRLRIAAEKKYANAVEVIKDMETNMEQRLEAKMSMILKGLLSQSNVPPSSSP